MRKNGYVTADFGSRMAVVVGPDVPFFVAIFLTAGAIRIER